MKSDKIAGLCLFLIRKVAVFVKFFLLKKNIADVKKNSEKEWRKWK